MSRLPHQLFPRTVTLCQLASFKNWMHCEVSDLQYWLVSHYTAWCVANCAESLWYSKTTVSQTLYLVICQAVQLPQHHDTTTDDSLYTVGHKKHTKMCFAITFIKLDGFWTNLADCFLNKFCIKQCKQMSPKPSTSFIPSAETWKSL